MSTYKYSINHFKCPNYFSIRHIAQVASLCIHRPDHRISLKKMTQLQMFLIYSTIILEYPRKNEVQP